jgi:putrescine aminotransferase
MDISLDDALKASKQQIEKWHKLYGNAGLVTMLKSLNFNRRFTSASNCYVVDEKGDKYLDFLGGYGSLNVGHNHPRIVNSLKKVLNDSPKILQAVLSSFEGALKAELANISPNSLQVSFLCNSGAEAIESAIKLARISTNRSKIVACHQGFHGKTMGALSVSGKLNYKKPFDPTLPDCQLVDYGNLPQLEKALDNQTAAFIVEPIQGEAGIILPPPGYLVKAQEICQRKGALFVVDEIQTGLGRTGRMFACQHDNLKPDVMTLAKSLSGGMVPIGAMITKKEIWNKAYGGMRKALLHTSTFGGNTLACVAALETIGIIKEQELPQKADENGRYLLAKLKKITSKQAAIKDVRGKGLMIGIEFQSPKLTFVKRQMENFSATMASLIAGDLLNKYKIITAFTLNNPHTIRLEPPLTIKKAEIDLFLQSFEDCCRRNASLAKALTSTVRNLI